MVGLYIMPITLTSHASKGHDGYSGEKKYMGLVNKMVGGQQVGANSVVPHKY